MFIISSFMRFLSKVATPYHDEDFADRQNNRISAFVFIVIGLTLFARDYAGTPVNCWAKGNWKRSWIQYARDYCFVEGTYYMPYNESLPTNSDLMREAKPILFYQWIPFIFILMGLVVMFPRYYWNVALYMSSLRMGYILDAGFQTRIKNKNLKTYLRNCIIFFDMSTADKIIYPHDFYIIRFYKRWISRHAMSAAYMGFKLYQFANIMFLLYLLTYFVADTNPRYLGFDVTRYLLYGVDWRLTGLFPRIGVCQFNITVLDNDKPNIGPRPVALNTMQCVLMTHMLIEKAYMLVWHGLVAIEVYNAYSIISWTNRLINSRQYLGEMISASLDVALPPYKLSPQYRRAQKEFEKARGSLHDKCKDSCARVQSNPDDIKALKTLENNHNALQNLIERHEANVRLLSVKRNEKRENYCKAMATQYGRFCDYVGSNGTVLFHLLTYNADEMISALLISRLFWKFVKEHEHDFVEGRESPSSNADSCSTDTEYI